MIFRFFITCITLLGFHVLSAQQLYQDAPAVLDAYIESNGGMENLRKIISIRAVGVVETPTDRFKSVFIRKRPDKWLFIRKQEGKSITTGFDGNTGWSQLSDGKRTRINKLASDNPLIRQQQQSDIEGELINYRKPGREVELLGIEGIGNERAYKIRLSNPDSEESIWYINTRNLREMRKEKIIYRDGREMLSVETYEDFIQVNGYWVPRKITRTVDSEVFSTTSFDVIEINAGIFNELFAMPVPDSPPVTSDAG